MKASNKLYLFDFSNFTILAKCIDRYCMKETHGIETQKNFKLYNSLQIQEQETFLCLNFKNRDHVLGRDKLLC